MIAEIPDQASQTTATNILGTSMPYQTAEKTQRPGLGSVQEQELQRLLDGHHKVMSQKSLDLMSGKITPYRWRQWHSSYAPNYDGQLKAYFQGSAECVTGTAGLYHAWQQLYADAELSDHSGVDWGKLDQLQNDFWSKHTDAEMTALQGDQAQQENAYPALGMYRVLMDNHRNQQGQWARQMGMSYTQTLPDAP